MFEPGGGKGRRHGEWMARGSERRIRIGWYSLGRGKRGLAGRNMLDCGLIIYIPQTQVGDWKPPWKGEARGSEPGFLHSL